MKLKLLKFIILVPAVVAALSACNSSTADDDGYMTGFDNESSTLVKSFSLRPNNKLMQNLDSVFFSIDQVRGEIFNADSLPWGTDVRRLVVSVQVQSTSGVEIVMPKLSDGTDTIINLLQNSTDSINFSRGSVWLRVTSANGDEERVYTVRVNVHNCNPDSLQWNMRPLQLPTRLTGVREQKTVEFQGRSFCLTRNASELQMSYADNPSRYAWDAATPSGLPADVMVRSLAASADALYIISRSGTLFSSTDGISWSRADTGWTHLYGGFGNDIVGVKGTRWEAFPSGASGAIPAAMPVSATSAMWTFTNEWAIEPQAIIAGGIRTDGTVNGQAWGFDGSSWMQLSGITGSYALPAASEMVLFPYFTFRSAPGKAFQTSRHSAWIALGGKKADGSINTDVYISLDNGINWRKAAGDLQLPAAIAPRCAADVVLTDKSFTGSRAVSPITRWDAPYIYMFGGTGASGQLFNQVWTGVINRLTFKPLQ